jgi:hypothetical protein
MEFECSDPSARVRAANIMAPLAAFELAPEMGNEIVVRPGLSGGHVRPDAFILVQNWLDAQGDRSAV